MEKYVVCEKCGTLMNYKRGRFGKYLSCPNCKTNKSLKTTEEKPTDIPCEKCGSMMVEKTGKFGRYLACPNFPKCKNTKPITEIVGKCPKCNKDIVKISERAVLDNVVDTEVYYYNVGRNIVT